MAPASYMVPRLSDAATRDVPTNFKKVEFDGLTTQSSSDAASRGVPSKPLRWTRGAKVTYKRCSFVGFTN